MPIVRICALAFCVLSLAAVAGCGEDDGGQEADRAAERLEQRQEEAKERRQRARERLERQLEREREKAQKAKQAAAAAAAAAAEPEPEPASEPEPVSDCDPNYSGACLDPNSPDYDCEGGSGDGPDYTGIVQVVGTDVYDLDADGDGTACDV